MPRQPIAGRSYKRPASGSTASEWPPLAARRERASIAADGRSSRCSGLFDLQRIRTHWRCGLRFESSERTDVCDQLLDLELGNAAFPCRHPVRSAFDDGVVDVLGVAAVDPEVIHQ